MAHASNPTPGILLNPAALRELIDRGQVCVVDARGENEYRKAHLPGAVNFPVTLLQDPESARGELLSPDVVAERLAARGIADAGRLAFYDESGLVPSARLFWFLEYLGRDEMSVLDGGFPAWVAAGLPVEAGDPPAPERAARFTARPREELMARKEDVLAAIGSPEFTIVDARRDDEYAGKSSTAARDGHIPGAVHVNWEQHIAGLLDPTYRSIDELRAIYDRSGVSPERRIITYCRSGARSSHSYLTLRVLGYPRVANYSGSWLEWGNDPDLPVERATE